MVCDEVNSRHTVCVSASVRPIAVISRSKRTHSRRVWVSIGHLADLVEE